MKRVARWVIAPLALGVLLYLALRGSEIRLFGWANAMGLSHVVGWLRSIAAPIRSHVPRVVVGSLPDACWAFAFGASLALVWKKPNIWMWIGAAVTASIEIAQALHLIEGVFDWVDLAAMVAAYFIAWRGICPAETSWLPRRDARSPSSSR